MSAADWIHPASSVTEYAQAGVRTLDAGELRALIADRTRTWADQGLAPGDRVLLATGSRLNTLVDLAATWEAGLTPVLLSDSLAPESYRLLAEATGARAVRATPAVARAWSRGGADDAAGVLLRLNPAAPEHAAPENAAPEHPAPAEPCLVLATSGSTGLPKAVVHPRSHLLRNAAMHWESVDPQAGPGSRYLLSQSLFFSSAFVCGVLGVLHRGMDLALVEPPFSVVRWAEAARDHRTTHTALTPHLLMRVLDGAIDLPDTLCQVTIGGDRLGGTALAALRDRGVPEVFTTYGLTEAGPRVATNPLTVPGRHDVLGTPLDGVELRLDPVPGEPVDPDRGELVVITPTAQIGSYRDGRYVPYPEGLRVPTGDICERLPDGSLRLVGRARRVASVAGEKVFLGLVERVLSDHPAVGAARVGPDPEGQGLRAEILPRPGAEAPDAAELRRWCRGRLRAVEVPRRFVAVDSATPLSK
ncbi:class I adenylate-forming enzyme family protein [Streptomyces sp. BI20]|uniref:class I adenylate-forming enzyme family protein n=1 Tax=Streptomyces sp. BI20 TaxID=3403460 RepID=UPI003C770F21